MSLLARLFGASTPGPIDDYWYQPFGDTTATGVRIDAETAMKISVFWRCVSIVAGSVAKLPLHVYERLDDQGSKRIATEHPMEQVLHNKPHPRYNSFRWRELLQGHLLLRGNSYCRVRPGDRYPVGSLEPIMPDLVTPKIASNGAPVYEVRDPNSGHADTLTREEIWHLPGLSLDGLTGLDVISYAKEGLGLSIAAEHYGAGFFGKNAMPDVVLTTDNALSEPGANRMKRDWQGRFGGFKKAHGTVVLEQGVKVQQVSLTNEQAQFLGLREFQASDVCRWIGVPNHMVGLTSKSTSWGTGIEQMSIGFVVYCLLDWIRRWEAAIGADLIAEDDGRYFAAFNVDGLLRGDSRTRHEAYRSGLTHRYYTRNEVRAKEDLNPVPGGNEFDPPPNASPDFPDDPPPPEDDEDEEDAA